MKALSIANVLFCLNQSLGIITYKDFFDNIQLKLLKRYICYGCLQIQPRELQCLFGIQTILDALGYPKG